MLAKNRVFTVRIWGALEIKSRKSAKRDCSKTVVAENPLIRGVAPRARGARKENFNLLRVLRACVSHLLGEIYAGSPASLRGERIHLDKNENGFEDPAAHDLQVFGAEFV